MVTMRGIAHRLALQAVGAVALGLLSGVAAADAPASPAGALARALQKGGYVIYLRHAEMTEPMDGGSALADCSDEPVLSEEGRARALTIGAGFATLAIPVTAVYVSPSCAAQQTAAIAFEGGEPASALRLPEATAPEDQASAAHMLRLMLSMPPARGTNTVLIAHESNLQRALGMPPVGPGLAHVFRPLADGRVETVGTIEPAAWRTLLASR